MFFYDTIALFDNFKNLVTVAYLFHAAENVMHSQMWDRLQYTINNDNYCIVIYLYKLVVKN